MDRSLRTFDGAEGRTGIIQLDDGSPVGDVLQLLQHTFERRPQILRPIHVGKIPQLADPVADHFAFTSKHFISFHFIH